MTTALQSLINHAQQAQNACKWEEASEAWKRCLAEPEAKGNPWWYEALLTSLLKMEHLEKAKALIDRMTVECPRHLADAARARWLSCAGRVDEALALWKTTIEASAGRTQHAWLICYGDLLLQCRRDAEATSAYAEADQRFPQNPGGLAGLLKVANSANDWLRAEQYLRAYIARFPRAAIPWCHYELGVALLRMCRVDEAGAQFDALRELSPKTHYWIVGRILADLSVKRFEHVVEHAKLAWDRHADVLPDWFFPSLARAFLAGGAIDEARTVLIRALQKHAVDSPARREILEQALCDPLWTRSKETLIRDLCANKHLSEMEQVRALAVAGMAWDVVALTTLGNGKADDPCAKLEHTWALEKAGQPLRALRSLADGKLLTDPLAYHPRDVLRLLERAGLRCTETLGKAACASAIHQYCARLGSERLTEVFGDVRLALDRLGMAGVADLLANRTKYLSAGATEARDVLSVDQLCLEPVELRVTNGRIFEYAFSIIGRRVCGWARCKGSAESLNVTISVDDEAVATLPADLPCDNKTNGTLEPGSYNSRFPGIAWEAPLSLMAKLPAGGSPIRVAIEEIPLQHEWRLLPDGFDRFQLHGSYSANGRICGWAWDPREPERDTVIELRTETTCLATMSAKSYRDDLARLGIKGGCAAFQFVAPAASALAPLRVVAPEYDVQIALPIAKNSMRAASPVYPRWIVAL